MLEFFTAQINNPHTRRAYLNAARRFAAWCHDHQIRQLAAVQPVHVAAFIQDLQASWPRPTPCAAPDTPSRGARRRR